MKYWMQEKQAIGKLGNWIFIASWMHPPSESSVRPSWHQMCGFNVDQRGFRVTGCFFSPPWGSLILEYRFLGLSHSPSRILFAKPALSVRYRPLFNLRFFLHHEGLRFLNISSWVHPLNVLNVICKTWVIGHYCTSQIIWRSSLCYSREIFWRMNI